MGAHTQQGTHTCAVSGILEIFSVCNFLLLPAGLFGTSSLCFVSSFSDENTHETSGWRVKSAAAEKVRRDKDAKN